MAPTQTSSLNQRNEKALQSVRRVLKYTLRLRTESPLVAACFHADCQSAREDAISASSLATGYRYDDNGNWYQTSSHNQRNEKALQGVRRVLKYT